MLKISQCFVAFVYLTIASAAFANISVPMYLTTQKGMGTPVGNVKIIETKYGLLFIPNLRGLTPGIRGFHIHEHPSCTENGMAAGGHLDPQKTAKHRGPYSDDGHLGDLPALYVAANGTATLPVLTPRIFKLADIKNHALMVHHGSDNYSDSPEKLGGGGMRMACGIIK